MVLVKVFSTNGRITKIEIRGHADSDSYGYDLVCAGISSVSVGILNALDILTDDTCNLEMKEGYVCIHVKNPMCEVTQCILKTLVIQLQTMEENYKKYIKINQQEV